MPWRYIISKVPGAFNFLQKVIIGETDTIEPSAILQISSTEAGLLVPRMTTAQRDAIINPANGLLIYNTTTNKLTVREGSIWVELGAGGGGGGSGGYAIIQDEGIQLPQRTVLNIVSAGMVASDDAANSRTQLSLVDILNAIANLTANGFIVKTGTGTTASRNIAAGAYIIITNSDGVAGNPTIAVDATVTPTANKIPVADSAGKLNIAWQPDNLRTSNMGITIGDGVNAITTGFKGAIWVPFAGTITEWTILSTDKKPPTSGSIVIDVLRSTYADYPTMSSIVGTGNKPSITSAQKGNGVPTGWTSTTINAGDCIGFEVTSVTDLTRITLVLKVMKS